MEYPKTVVVEQMRAGNPKVIQSFADAYDGKHIYVMQVSNTLTGERNGHITVSRVSTSTWKVVGKMWLRGFGHGISFGSEPGGWLWVECSPIVRTAGSARGCRVVRIKFQPGKTLKPPKGGFRVAGATKLTPAVDCAANLLGIRYWKQGKYRWSLYKLSEAKKGRLVRVAGPMTMPSERTFQGWCVHKGYVYQLSGANRETPLLHKKNYKTGVVSRVEFNVKLKGHSEPEGIAFVGDKLWYGIASGKLGDRWARLTQVEGF